MIKTAAFVPLLGLAVFVPTQQQPAADPGDVRVEAPGVPPADRSLPPSPAADDMLGRTFPFEQLSWVRKPRAKLPGQVTLVRWWTDTCPYCEKSLPAITRLGEEFADRGLNTVAVYHPKPPRPVGNRQIKRFAAARQYRGPVAVDADWSLLNKFYLEGHPHKPTSVSFIVDRRGAVRFVHPGPVFFKTDEAELVDVNRDYEAIRRAIDVLLSESVH